MKNFLYLGVYLVSTVKDKIERELDKLTLSEQLEIIEKIINKVKKQSMKTNKVQNYDDYFGIVEIDDIDKEIESLRNEWERDL